MVRQDREREISIWMGDAKGALPADRLLSGLDRLLGAQPDSALVEAARRRAHKALQAQMPEPIYYDSLPDSPVGPLYVAVSETGVLALDFTGSEEEFVGRLGERLRAPLRRSAQRAGQAVEQLRAYLNGRRTDFDLPLDLRMARDFQRQVLLAALKVPRGSVATYGQIARRIGRPGAARAVGQALGHNPLPIIIPCHRVLAANGTLGGYSGRDGIRTKARLLELEGVRYDWGLLA
jgi:methylated-DNA-[protein]-cysteine S-methyltransferase